jgi:adenine deaminase
MTAIQMATLNTAQHFGLEREIGSITPGRRADIVITSDLTALPIELVIAGGQVVAEKGRILIDIPPYSYPDFAVGTVKLGKRLAASDFGVPFVVQRFGAAEAEERAKALDYEPAPLPAAQPPHPSISVRVIGVVENQAPTKALEAELPVVDGLIQPDLAQDVCRIALVERHRATGGVVNGFVSGFGFNTPCAVASTVAHDSHHMIVVGTDAADMARAANRLGEVGGGVVVFKEGQEIALVELPIAGLMSNERAEVVAAKAERMVEAFRECGCALNNAYMQLSLLALVVIPELRISDLGVVDVRRFEVVPLIIAV